MTPIEQILADAASIPREEISACGQWIDSIQDGEEELGEAPQDVKALFTLLQRIGKAHNVLKAGMEFEEPDPGKAFQQILLQHRYEILKGLVWFSTRVQLQLFGEGFDFIGLRRNWKIVRMPTPPRPQEAAERMKKLGLEIQIRPVQPEEGEDPED